MEKVKDKIFLGADHAGWKMKEMLESELRAQGYDVYDLGNKKLDSDDDYPDFGFAVAREVAKNKKAKGILLCGNAQGVCIVANKVKGIRAITGFSSYAAKTSRADDDANILCLPGRVLAQKEAKAIVKIWLATPFSQEPRHMRRLKKLKKIEERYG